MRKTNVLWLMPTQEPWWWEQSIKLFGLLRDHYSIHKQESWQKKQKKAEKLIVDSFCVEWEWDCPPGGNPEVGKPDIHRKFKW